ncbi:ATP-binding cassette domain-containing protein [Desulfosporosinus hippei]|uniref:Peptide/nickel transport system ATP-binding protein/oligopeptide transport system ATP-binding protein n=1 Tax=Desulfosporosinus hippei DSM 8344 TaxID=1121419 RepID=A0A1G7T6W6_9FIRM|nr:ATP-binding cassette domain-containing protein [Desulfosporosinus hippei]SDG31036.1 peptide/nickel transport system ATP-binding protein/oligopeptide transport system ATP-binding protein [Desulfosporosinus hippei DSM 8344]
MLIEVKDLVKDYRVGILKNRCVRAVDCVSFSLQVGETLGLVGESGCGKSTLARLILMLIKPTFGRVCFEGQDLTDLSQAELLKLRREMQIVFQQPQQSLHPRMKLAESLAEPLRLYKLVKSKAAEKERVRHLLHEVGLSEEHLERYPHELSGGQAQRVALARVLALKPKFIVADEPTSMLDVAVQAQILSLIKKLQQEHKIGMLFISHDLEVIRGISDRVAVMQGGKLVEMGSKEQIFREPQHPYTKFLTGTVFELPTRLKRDNLRLVH